MTAKTIGLTVIVSTALVSTGFALIGAMYGLLPLEIPVMRDLSGHPTRWAAKSAITAFRVPTMGGIVTAVAIVMLHRASIISNPKHRASYARMFLIFAITAAMKSATESLEIAAMATPVLLPYEVWLWRATAITALAGIALAILCGWPVLISGSLADWRMLCNEKRVLVVLLMAYALIAIVPVLNSEPIRSTP